METINTTFLILIALVVLYLIYGVVIYIIAKFFTKKVCITFNGNNGTKRVAIIEMQKNDDYIIHQLKRAKQSPFAYIEA